MNQFDEMIERDYFGHDSAVREALRRTEKGLFDATDYAQDEDLDALFGR